VSEVNQVDVVEFGDYDASGHREVSFEEFVDGTAGRLFATALLMTDRNRAEAEDLLQSVLERAFRRWRRICRDGDPEPYVRKMLVNASVDKWRQVRRRAEQPLDETCPATMADRSAEIEDRDLLLRALAELPAGQRAVLVLRYFSDMSEAETAQTLGCTVGSVKSQAARGLAKLRDITERSGTPNQRGDVLP
jgi:RNA polymerase sigma-70 factor (sigma-E family)